MFSQDEVAKNGKEVAQSIRNNALLSVVSMGNEIAYFTDALNTVRSFP